MTDPIARPAPEGDDEAAMLARHGIVRVPADRFHVDGYRYDRLADAVAQALRSRPEAA